MIFTRNQQASQQSPDMQANQHWVHLAEALAKRWEALTVADLAQVQHKLSQLADVIQQRYQLTVDEARQQVLDFERSLVDEAQLAYTALGVRIIDMRARGSKLRHDISEFGWQVMAERTIARHPGYVVGLGAVLGLAVGLAIGASTRRPRRW